ncbi:uncharacterized protein LOC125738816 isoform X4 [Brienomyrus brachyistius]|uniref:uncharacterized protein LOC125738816 isoform X4 n=1 Tax=Brienomyrus brachyistius TaxID=42636 RepID=UPI0020B329C8|nr:uncharacterized protein LOC125738816 isoform X4 [Brienomyrus brachyistius]
MDTLPVFTTGSEATGDTIEVVGFSKPLHRFMRADPKSIGVAMVILGSSLLITGIAMMPDIMGNNPAYRGLWLGTVVTASLALSIASLITGGLAFMINLSTFIIQRREDIYYYDYDINYSNLTDIDDFWGTFHKGQVSCMEGIWLLHCFVGCVILIVMTAFSRAALGSTKTQATVIMYNRPSE